ncbi:putative O-methyltransferase [Ilyonectria robusta]
MTEPDQVGGSSGHDAINLAMSFPSLKFIVQDQSANEARFQSNLPADLVSRISFQTHDFFTPQPISADVYMLKMILHDWPNKQAISILQNLKHNLKPGAVILLCENVQPAAFDQEGNRILPVTAHRMASCLDLQMLAVFNNLERTIEQWDALIKEADEHFEIRSVVTVPGSIQSILEVVLNF